MSETPAEPVVAAAGGIVSRRMEGVAEVVVIHRPKYDDWTLPKGKLAPGETFREAAVREIEEETGLRCRLHRELDPVRYRDTSGRPKLVRYWLMTVLSGSVAEREPDAEVDAVRWVDLETAAQLLTYPRDRALLESIASDELPY